MTFLKLVVSFAPWIAFLIIAKGTVLRLEIGLVVALILTVLMAVLRLHRGIIMWVGILFFTAATIAVLGFHDMWTIKHMGVMASGALAVGAWAGLLVGKPFSLAYAGVHPHECDHHRDVGQRIHHQRRAGVDNDA